MQRQRQRQRSGAGPSPARRSQAARRRPEWNGYLTDADRYRLSQRQQLQRQLQQLSTAHFAPRSPPPSVRRAASTPGAATPRSPMSRGVGGSAGRAARRLQFADESASPGSLRSARIESPMGDFGAGLTPRRRLAAHEKASLQSELAALERMLWDLEVETERLGLKQADGEAGRDEENDRRGSEALSYNEDEEEEDQDSGHDGSGDEEETQQDPGSRARAEEERDERARLEEVCHKSLSVSMDLAQKVNLLTKQLEDERRLRHEHEMRVDVLERELRATQAKCDYLEAKCDGMSSQVEEMHEAVMSTDDAIHRMAQAFDRTRFSPARSPSTPHRQGYSTPSTRKTPIKSALKRPPRSSPASAAPRGADSEGDEPTHAENLPPNRQH